jgi:hypothetical protein
MNQNYLLCQFLKGAHVNTCYVWSSQKTFQCCRKDSFPDCYRINHLNFEKLVMMKCMYLLGNVYNFIYFYTWENLYLALIKFWNLRKCNIMNCFIKVTPHDIQADIEVLRVPVDIEVCQVLANIEVSRVQLKLKCHVFSWYWGVTSPC